MKASRFKWLEKPAGKSERHAVLVPEFPPPPGLEAQQSRIGQRLAFDMLQKRRGGLVIADVARTVDVSVACPVLQGNSPLPAGLMSPGARVRNETFRPALAGDRERAIARQPVRPVLVAGAQRLFDEQPAETRAIQKEIAGNRGAIFQANRFDEPALAMAIDADDLAFDANDATLLGVTPQESGVEPRVEVERIGELRHVGG